MLIAIKPRRHAGQFSLLTVFLKRQPGIEVSSFSRAYVPELLLLVSAVRLPDQNIAA